MSRSQGIFGFSGNYEPLYAEPLDARTVVTLYSDLTTASTWVSFDNRSYLFNGLLVCVTGDTSDNNGLYILQDKANFTSTDAWRKLADITQIQALEEKIETITGGGAIQVETKADLPNIGSTSGVYFVKDENATYRWDDSDLVYYCVGRDYEDIKVLNGGDAAEFE